MKEIAYKISLLIDLIKWKISTILLCKEVKKGKKNIIISEINTSIASVKFNCILSKCLEMNGYNVYILFQKKTISYELYYRSLKIKNFIYLSNYDGIKISSLKKIKSIKSFSKLLNLKYQNINVGKWICSRILNEKKIGNFKIEDLTQNELTKYLNTSFNSVDSIINLEKNMKDFDIIFNERGYSPSGEIFEYCLKTKKKVIQWFGSPLDGFNCFKKYTYQNKDTHPLTLSDETFRYLLNHKSSKIFQKAVIKYLDNQYKSGRWFNRQDLQSNKEILNKSEIVRLLKLDPQKKIAVIFSHVFNDATFFYGKSLFKDYEDWLKQTLLEAIKNKKINWILKIHPANLWRSKIENSSSVSLEEKLLNKIFDEIPSNLAVIKPDSKINTYSFFNSIDYGLTVRGTIGCELASFGIPVLTAGTGRYSNKGFTIDSSSINEFKNKVRKIHLINKLSKNKIRRARIYTYGSLIGRAIPMDGLRMRYNLEKSIFRPYHMDVPVEFLGLSDYVKKKDIRLLIKWIQSNQNYDFIELK